MSPSPLDAQQDLAEILDAVEMLRRTQPSSPAVREALFDQIFAASSHGGGEAQRFAGAGRAGSETRPEWLSAISGAALDAQSAYLLAAVAVERGEVSNPEGAPSPGDLLDSAVNSAQNQLLDQKPSAEHARFGSAPDASPPSTDIASALANFRDSADKAIVQILDTSDRTIRSLTMQICQHAAALINALQALPQLASIGDGASAFVSLAIEKFRSAVNYLRNLLADFGSEAVKDMLRQFQPHLTVRDALAAVYHVDTIRADTAKLQLRPDATVAEVDSARRQVAKLMKDFERFMTILRSARSALIVVAGIIVAHLAGPLLPLITPAVDALAAGVALMAGLNCLGEAHVLKEIRGIRLIEESLKQLVLS